MGIKKQRKGSGCNSGRDVPSISRTLSSIFSTKIKGKGKGSLVIIEKPNV
jgi:hypothetical protein